MNKKALLTLFIIPLFVCSCGGNSQNQDVLTSQQVKEKFDSLVSSIETNHNYRLEVFSEVEGWEDEDNYYDHTELPNKEISKDRYITYEVSENLTAKCFESSIVKAEPSEVNDFFSHFNVDPEQGMPLVRFK